MKTRLLSLIGFALTLFYPVTALYAQGEIQAIPIEYGQTVNGEVPNPDEPVIFIFEGSASDRVTITVTTNGLTALPVIGLFTSNGTLIITSDTGTIEGETLSANDIYLIVVQSRNGGVRFTLTLENAADRPSAMGCQGQPEATVPIRTGESLSPPDFEGNWDIYTVNPDGSDLQRLTSGAGSKFAPMWSPDASQIAYRYMDNTQSSIYVMNADGSNPHRVSRGNSADYSAAWSPDGTEFVVSSGTNWNVCDIYIMDVDGSNRRLVVDTNQTGNSPVWWPNGERIVFNLLEDGTTNVYVVNADGSDLTLLVPDARDISVSPDGTMLVFSAYLKSNWDIYIVLDEVLYQITDTREEEARPVWSPDQRSLAFMQSDDNGNIWQIMRIGVDGSGLAEVSDSNGNSIQAHWSPG